MSEQNDSSPTESKRKWYLDRSAVSTIAVVIISLCALIVSIFQTRVLTLQQEIMLENAKAGQWPNLELGMERGYDRKQINFLNFNIANTGTGPAIIDNVTIEYNGKYACSWMDMLLYANLPDSVSRTLTYSRINGRVMQPGEKYIFLSVTDNQPLMEFLVAEIDR